MVFDGGLLNEFDSLLTKNLKFKYIIQFTIIRLFEQLIIKEKIINIRNDKA